MFGFLRVFLGFRLNNYPWNLLFQVESKITLGLGGIMIVLLSVAASIGVFGFAEVAATLIIFEIIPFLVLAVGVDNIFILVQKFQRTERKPSETLPEHVGRVLGEVGPSMLLSSVSESTCFFLGALSDMPAVRAFALYSGMALLFDFFMQITCFVSLIALDAARQEDNRFDVACCFKASKKVSDRPNEGAQEGTLYKLFKYFYAPFLMKKWVRPTVVVTFFAWLCFSLATVNKIEIGLDQEVSMPDDSYMLKYFDYMQRYLSVGPPFYIVVNNTGLKYDFSQEKLWKRLCGRAGCDQYSVANQLKLWSLEGETTYLASSGAQSWIDDYITYMTSSSCCNYDNFTMKPCPRALSMKKLKKAEKKKKKNDFFGDDDFFDYETDDFFDGGFDEPVEQLKTDDVSTGDQLPDSYFSAYDDYYFDIDADGNKKEKEVADGTCSKVNCALRNESMVTGDVFRSYLRLFLQQDPDSNCAAAGHAAYVNAICLVPRQQNRLEIPPAPIPPDARLPRNDIEAVSFMAFHTILKTSHDYYEALRWARRLSENLTATLNEGLDIPEEDKVVVFPYSVFYVFYEQYLTMWPDTLQSLGISLVAIFIVTFFLMGLDLRSAVVVIIIIAMILVNMGGLMYWWHITLNAVSLVNLVMAIGISVEFCAHITRSFAVNVGENKIARARDTLVNMGSSVSSTN